jgi:TonB family protein
MLAAVLLSGFVAQATPTAAPACLNEATEAAVLYEAQPKVSAQTLSQAKAAGAGSVAMVQVLLGPDGKVQDAKVYQSTNDADLDAAALAAARNSTYAPKMVYCKAYRGVYLFEVKFPIS